jgi:hypothetical protein
MSALPHARSAARFLRLREIGDHFIKNCPTNGDPKHDMVGILSGVPALRMKTNANGSVETNDTKSFGCCHEPDAHRDMLRLLSTQYMSVKSLSEERRFNCGECRKVMTMPSHVTCCPTKHFCLACILSRKRLLVT